MSYKSELEARGIPYREATHCEAEQIMQQVAVCDASIAEAKAADQVASDIEASKVQWAKEAVDANHKLLNEFIVEFGVEFAVEQSIKGASMIEAKAAFSDVLKERLDRAKKGESIGAPPVKYGDSAMGTPTTDALVEQVKSLAADEGISKREALRRLHRDNPDLVSGTHI